MKEPLFHGYDRQMKIARDEGVAAELIWLSNDEAMIEVKVYESPKRASAFLPPDAARALAAELLRCAEVAENGGW